MYYKTYFLTISYNIIMYNILRCSLYKFFTRFYNLCPLIVALLIMNIIALVWLNCGNTIFLLELITYICNTRCANYFRCAYDHAHFRPWSLLPHHVFYIFTYAIFFSFFKPLQEVSML